MAKKEFGSHEEDAQALTDAYNDALVEYAGEIGPVSLGDLIQSFNGSKGALARSLAGLPETGKLSDLSRSQQSKYATQFKNIDRWSRYEAGERSKQARNIERSKVTQNKVKNIFARREPPRGNVTATITGWIGYDRDWRYRTITIPAIGREVDTEAFNTAMQAGDTSAAYRALFDAYAPALQVAQADHFKLTYE
jgi:hypothetical protein